MRKSSWVLIGLVAGIQGCSVTQEASGTAESAAVAGTTTTTFGGKTLNSSLVSSIVGNYLYWARCVDSAGKNVNDCFVATTGNSFDSTTYSISATKCTAAGNGCKGGYTVTGAVHQILSYGHYGSVLQAGESGTADAIHVWRQLLTPITQTLTIGTSRTLASFAYVEANVMPGTAAGSCVEARLYDANGKATRGIYEFCAHASTSSGGYGSTTCDDFVDDAKDGFQQLWDFEEDWLTQGTGLDSFLGDLCAAIPVRGGATDCSAAARALSKVRMASLDVGLAQVNTFCDIAADAGSIIVEDKDILVEPDTVVEQSTGNCPDGQHLEPIVVGSHICNSVATYVDGGDGTGEMTVTAEVCYEYEWVCVKN